VQIRTMRRYERREMSGQNLAAAKALTRGR